MLIKKIKVSQEQCISTGNFESKRIQYGIEAELSETDNYKAVYNHLRGIIEEELKKEYNNVKETVSEPKSIVPELSLPLKQFDPTDTRLEIKCPKCNSPMTLQKWKNRQNCTKLSLLITLNIGIVK